MCYSFEKMAKGNNTGKSRRSHNYKPYDAANSSFVKRITSRVTDILPGPSWISSWWTPAPQVNVRQNRSDDEEEEEERQQQPPIKRIRIETSTNDYSQQNHVKQLSDLQDKGDLSPINRVGHYDDAVAGPSGLHIRSHANLVSSTPATTQTSSTVIKVNADNRSDSGESTSGCSSLVPQAERTSSNTVLTKLNNESHRVNSPSSMRTLSTKDAYSKMNLSTSLSARPSFDHYVFHNPHNKSMNSSRSSLLDDSSTFYKGRTMYGGASARRESLMNLSTPISKPRVTSVKPVSRQSSDRDTIGTSALRVLRALEQISSPVTDAKKMPLNQSVKRRKPIQPYEELMIPRMPTLLRLKRKQRSENASSSVEVHEDKDVTDEPSFVRNNSEETPSVPSSSNKITTAQVLPSYSLSKDESTRKEKYVARIKGKHSESIESERPQEVNLPNIKLDITSLPKFSLPLVNKTVTTSISTPVSNVHHPSSESTFSSVSTRTSSSFKFSDPLIESTDGHKISSIKTSFTFSNPLDADSMKNEHDFQNVNKTTKDRSFMKQDQVKAENLKPYTSNLKLKKKNNHEVKSNTVATSQATKMQSGTVMDFFNKINSDVIGKNKSTSYDSPTIAISDNISKSTSNSSEVTKSSTLEKKTSGVQSSDRKWSCKKCSVENNNSEKKCIKCGISKLNDSTDKGSLKDKEEVVSSDFIECKACSSSHKASEKCTTTSIMKSDVTTANSTSVTSTSSSIPLSALFKKSAGSWECDTCLVSNNSESDSCVSCCTPKPGTTPKTEAASSKPSFQFGIPSSTTDTNTNAFTFGFGVSNNDNKGSAINTATGGFKFGTDSTSSTTTQEFKFGSVPSSSEPETKVTFSFGFNPQDTQKKETEQNEKSIATKFTFGSISGNKVIKKEEEDSKIQESEKDPQQLKKVRFSQQLVQEKTISSDGGTDSTPSTFNFSNNAKSDQQNWSSFSFPTTAPLFSNVPTSKSDKLPNILFTFSSSSTTTTSTTSTPVTTSTPSTADNAVKVSSTLSTNSDNEKTSPSFSFLSNNVSKPLFSSSETDKKEGNGVFGGFSMNNKTSEFSTNVPSISANFTFGSSNNDNKSNAEKESKKDGISNSIFAEKRSTDSNQPTLFNVLSKKEENIFGASKNDNKSLFFTTNANENIFGSTKTAEEWNSKPTFGTKSFEQKPSTATSATPFCTSTTVISNNTETKNEPFTFNASSSQTNNITPFVFKGNEMRDNKSSGSFAFNAPCNNQIQNANVFGSNAQTTPSVFSSTTPSLFNAGARSNNNTSGPSFTFGNPQPQPPQGLFSFTAPSQTPSGQSTIGEAFTFGSQNAVAQNNPISSAPVPPSFDPNIKPNFNFSDGAGTPSFSAQSSDLPKKEDRKIRKAVRRTLR